MSNKEIIKNYTKRVWQQKDLSAIDDVFVVDAVIHSPLNTTQGAITMKSVVEKWLTAFPDLTIESDDFIAEGDQVVHRWKASGTHMGSFFDTSPSHQEVTYSGITIFTLNDDAKVAEYWALVDMHAILAQLMKYESIADVVE
jgi:predicted ester cyclase